MKDSKSLNDTQGGQSGGWVERRENHNNTKSGKEKKSLTPPSAISRQRDVVHTSGGQEHSLQGVREGGSSAGHRETGVFHGDYWVVV